LGGLLSLILCHTPTFVASPILVNLGRDLDRCLLKSVLFRRWHSQLASLPAIRRQPPKSNAGKRVEFIPAFCLLYAAKRLAPHPRSDTMASDDFDTCKKPYFSL
jgi:hypothetical protein